MPTKRQSQLRIQERFLSQPEERSTHWQEAIDKYLSLSLSLSFTEDTTTVETERKLP